MKRALRVLLVLPLVLTLAACGLKGDLVRPEATPPTPAPEAPESART
jgi:predicted small lipoprotein YifL